MTGDGTVTLVLRLPTEQYAGLVEQLTIDVLADVSGRLGLTDDPLFDTRQAGRYLGYDDEAKGAARIRDLAYRNEIDPDYDGARLLVRRSELDRYLSRQKAEHEAKKVA